MSAKVFKRARQLARKVTGGQKLNQLVGRKHTVKKGENTYERVQALNQPGTTRAVYRHFKKLLRLGMTIRELEQSILPQLEPKK